MSTEKDLASARSATDLVPGDVDAVQGGAQGMRDWAEVLVTASAGLAKLDSSDWTGEAADRFRDIFKTQPKKWSDAAHAFSAAGTAIISYGYSLAAAQVRAGDALALYRKGVEQTKTDKGVHENKLYVMKQEAAASAAIGVPYTKQPPTFVDSGAPMRAEAVALLELARRQVDEAGNDAARTVKEATKDAPEKPAWYESASSAVGGAFEDFGVGAWNDVLVPGINNSASFGKALYDNPGDVMELMLGAAMIGGGGGIIGGGGALDATVVGSVVGVPLNLAGAAVVGAGAGVVAKGFSDLLDKANKNQIQVVERRTKAERLADPGYKATPQPPAETPPGSPEFNQADADAVPPWGLKNDKTAGRIVVNDEKTVDQLSGYNGPGTDPQFGGPGTGRNAVVRTHVESHAGATLQPGDNAVLYINREPCDPANGQGCATLLARFVPKGAKLTIYPPSGNPIVVTGKGPV